MSDIRAMVECAEAASTEFFIFLKLLWGSPYVEIWTYVMSSHHGVEIQSKNYIRRAFVEAKFWQPFYSIATKALEGFIRNAERQDIEDEDIAEDFH
ncbi:hypothetical protein SUGI_0174980 [Cryptomeria japonica]|nr:hypothetical protein SUGI_0174980 [Cryptomeria japonica]